MCADPLSSEEHACEGELVDGERGQEKGLFGFVLFCFALRWRRKHTFVCGKYQRFS